MKIEKNTVVSFHYQLSEADGDFIESSSPNHPTLYLHGAGNILPSLERALEGREAGEHVDITLSSLDAYGPRLPNRQQRVPAKYLKHEGKIKPGQVVRFNTDQGQESATVIKVGKFAVDVDLNHPLAGKALHFAIDIDSVRAATDEEIRHGHAHGPGGHQH